MPLLPSRALPACRSAIRLVGAAAILLAAGCTSPAVSWKEPLTQQNASNIRDWRVAADRVVQSMEEKGVLPVAGMAPSKMAGGPPFPGPYYVHVMAQGSTFLEEVRFTIEQDLMKRGIKVARVPAGATVLNLDVDVVTWSLLHPFPGVLPLAAGAIGDLATDAYPTPDSEAVWKASIVVADRVVMKSSEIIYIDPGDVPLYRGTVTLAALPSPGTSMLGATRQIRYAP